MQKYFESPWKMTASLLMAAFSIGNLAYSAQNGWELGKKQRSGGDSSGGGDAAILPDDSVILADPYVVRDGANDIQSLNTQLVAELSRVGKFLVRYGAKQISLNECVERVKPEINSPQISRYLCEGLISSRSSESEFMRAYVFDPLIEYRFVTSLPTNCPRGDGQISVPDGTTVSSLACTIGKVTWIQKDLFQKMSIREQAKTIVHERLRALPMAIPLEFIADVTSGIEVILDLYNQQLSDKKPNLDAKQVATVELLRRRINQIGLVDGTGQGLETNRWAVHKNGGGLAETGTEITGNGYLGVGSLLATSGKISNDAIILNASCYNVTCQLAQGARLSQSIVNIKNPIVPSGETQRSFNVSIGKNAKIILSRVLSNDGQEQEMTLQEGAELSRSTIFNPYIIDLKEMATLRNNILYIGGLGSTGPILTFEAGTKFENMPYLGWFLTRDNSDVPGPGQAEIIFEKNTAINFENKPLCIANNWHKIPLTKTYISSYEKLKDVMCDD